jgi:hypothetical protein
MKVYRVLSEGSGRPRRRGGKEERVWGGKYD